MRSHEALIKSLKPIHFGRRGSAQPTRGRHSLNFNVGTEITNTKRRTGAACVRGKTWPPTGTSWSGSGSTGQKDENAGRRCRRPDRWTRHRKAHRTIMRSGGYLHPEFVNTTAEPRGFTDLEIDQQRKEGRQDKTGIGMVLPNNSTASLLLKPVRSIWSVAGCQLPKVAKEPSSSLMSAM